MNARKQRIVHTYPVEVGRIIRALNEKSPLTSEELREATAIKAWLLRHLLDRLEEEKTIDHGYPEDPRDSVAVRYWLTWDLPGHPDWLTDPHEDDDEEEAV